MHFDEDKSPRLIKVEYLIGRRYLIRIAADPVDDIAPSAHSSFPLVRSPQGEIFCRPQQEQRASRRLRFSGHNNGEGEGESESFGQPVVSLFDPAPARALASHIIIDRDE